VYEPSTWHLADDGLGWIAAVSLEIREYNPGWLAAASRAIAELLSELPAVFIHVEHIGSTAIPGLAAKPVIDLMAAVETLDVALGHESELAALGYERVAAGMPNRLLYARHQEGRTSYHLHVVLQGSWDTRNERLLRDYLRSHPEDAVRYAALKRQLGSVQASSADYTRGKTTLIQELTDRARAERGMPSVAVWEE
jgi:GrpB-like predicted nucleotidyltransferase (UPF0157 family)